jgi:hypothetical protein
MTLKSEFEGRTEVSIGDIAEKRGLRETSTSPTSHRSEKLISPFNGHDLGSEVDHDQDQVPLRHCGDIAYE